MDLFLHEVASKGLQALRHSVEVDAKFPWTCSRDKVISILLGVVVEEVGPHQRFNDGLAEVDCLLCSFESAQLHHHYGVILGWWPADFIEVGARRSQESRHEHTDLPGRVHDIVPDALLGQSCARRLALVVLVVGDREACPLEELLDLSTDLSDSPHSVVREAPSGTSPRS